MRRPVVALVVEAGRGDDVDAGPARQLGELAGVAAGIARHRIDDGPQPEAGRVGQLGRHPIDIGQVEVGRQQRPAGRRR